MFDVCLLGTGGMMPLPNRWLTACFMRYAGTSLLIDCGEGTQITMRLQGWSFKAIDYILFTHYHGDHISGLPGLLLTIGNSGRTERVTLIGPRNLPSFDCAGFTVSDTVSGAKRRHASFGAERSGCDTVPGRSRNALLWL